MLHGFSLTKRALSRQIRNGFFPPLVTFWERYVSIDIKKANEQNSAIQSRKRKLLKERRDSGRASYRFIDRTRVHVSGGSGGKGSLSMHRIGRKQMRRPDGGHGGHGGSVIIVADASEQSLRWTRPHVTAESGAHGSSQEKHGRNGKNTVLRVPRGVVVRRVLDYDEQWDDDTKTAQKLTGAANLEDVDEDDFHEGDYIFSRRGLLSTEGVSGPSRQPYLASLDYDSEESDSDSEDTEQGLSEIYEDFSFTEPETKFTPWGEREKVVVADLNQPGSYAVVARGGRGGTGSSIFKSHNGPIPSLDVLSEYSQAESGESVHLELELKLIADIGLVGFPNAGKSSLLAAMSRATPHIAPYPFTTLNPLVGYIEYQDGFRVCAADIPGLIGGASEGRGKGHDFLRHLERTKALLYMVDAAGVDGRDPVDDLQILVDELAAFGDGAMLERNALVVANKMDLLDDSEMSSVLSGLERVVENANIQMQGEIMRIRTGLNLCVILPPNALGTGAGISPLRSSEAQEDHPRHFSKAFHVRFAS